ncbi:MAG: hypothetical protein JWO03_2439 [Bacteroidetes bacterium]|nr:hypothetical protein [Bacteroidota bacterium]
MQHYLKALYRFFAVGTVMLMFVISVDAQDWALPSSRWEYITESPGITGPAPPPMYCCELHVEKDTVVNNTLCRKISGAAGHFTYYTYDSLGIVYILLDYTFRPTYNFNALVGDTLMFYDDTTRYQPAFYVPERRFPAVVDSITLLSNHGQDLRLYHMRSWRYGTSPQSFFSYHYFNYAERIGLYDGGPWGQEAEIFYPLFTTPTDYPWFYICDYADSAMTGGYWFYEKNCLTTGIHEYRDDYLMKCYPSPSSGTFTIDMSAYPSAIKQLHIYDALGQVVYSGESDQTQETLVLHLASGMYTVEICENSRYHRGKLIIHQ